MADTNSKKRNLHEGHRQRLKQAMLLKGFDDLPEHIILEFALFYTNKRKDTNELAHILIDRFGSLSGVCDAPLLSLLEVDGVGYETAVFLKFLIQFARAYEVSLTSRCKIISNADEAIEYLKPQFFGRTNECLIVVYLDGMGKILNSEMVCEGDGSTVSVDTGKILLSALGLHSSAVIIAHNHPKGFANPSNADIAMTDNLSNVLRETGIVLCDHLIFSHDEVCRMSQSLFGLRNYFGFN